MQASVRSRNASDSDRAFAWSLYADSIRELVEPLIQEERGVPWSEEEEARRFEEIWEPQNTQIFELEDRPIGWIAVKRESGYAFLENFFIAPEVRGRGLGTAALAWLKEQIGDATIRAHLLPNSRARSFYERAGFVLEREDKHQVTLVAEP
jgi:GNAT superfamily N-acetyltransferase